jgi:hypothetical protein
MVGALASTEDLGNGSHERIASIRMEAIREKSWFTTRGCDILAPDFGSHYFLRRK